MITLLYCLRLFWSEAELWCHSVQKTHLFVCMCHVPVFLHVISLTVPSSTEPVGLNPFDDEDDEEEMTAEQPNSSPANVKKEEVVAKMLVNGRHLLLFCSRSLHIYFPSLCCLMPILFVFLFAFIFPQWLLIRWLLFWVFCMVAQCSSCVKHVYTVLCIFVPQCNLVLCHATVQSDLFRSVLKNG